MLGQLYPMIGPHCYVRLPAMTRLALWPRKLLATALVWLFATSLATASHSTETSEFADAVAQTKTYQAEFGADRVLFVVDVDNTLLAMDQALGSDQWFEWQDHLIANEPQSPYRVADDFPGLLRVQGILFASGTMHAPQPDLPQLVAEIQDLGVPTLVLTSRGDDYRASTLRELDRNGYNFRETSPAIRLFRNRAEIDETCVRWIPYDVEAPDEAGLSAAEVEHFALSPEPREISYGDGLVMSSGQHKGAILLALLHLMPSEYDAIVFVDDNLKNVHRVYDALVQRDIECSVFHYKREEPNVKRFVYGDKSSVDRQWRRIARALSVTAPALDNAK